MPHVVAPQVGPARDDAGELAGPRWRWRRTVTQAASGTVFTAHPWCSAALRCDNVAPRDWLSLSCSDVDGST